MRVCTTGSGVREGALLLAVLVFGGPASAAQFTVEAVPFATGLPRIVDIASAGDERLFVADREGFIRIVEANGTVRATPFLDIDEKTGVFFESGFLGLVFHPDYAGNGFFYVNYVNGDGNLAIARYSVSADPNVADPDSEIPILTIVHPAPNHNGGDLAFGPDGYLYISVGDATTSANGQAHDTLLGKLLRIDVDGGAPYAIPPDNPFVGDPLTLDEIWAIGFRNPWRFSFDRVTGDLFIGDVGQNTSEEIDFEPAGSPGGLNYGWRCYEGNDPFDLTGCGPIGDYIFPIHAYPHDPACSVTGGFVYRGSRHPQLIGHYVFSDFCSGDLWTLVSDGMGGWQFNSHGPGLPLFSASTFGEGVDGEVYAGSLSDQTVYRIVSRLGCPAEPLGGCRQTAAGDSQLLVRDDPDGDPSRRKLTWKWKRGDATPLSVFGDPLPDDLALCLYAGTTEALAVEAGIPSAFDCPTCWSASPTVFKYKDAGTAAQGIRRMTLKAGEAGRAKIVVKGAGELLPALPAIPVTEPLRLQLISSTDECWEAQFSAGATKNAKGVFKDASD